MITDDQGEYKFDDIRQISSLPYYSSVSSGLLSNGKQENGPECLSKNLLLNILSRDRRASISRLFFNHWRGSRDNSRYIPKNLLAFSPRLGKRAYEDDNEFNVPINKQQVEEDNGTPDLDTFLVTLIGHLQRKKIDIVYEDSTKLCLSEAVNDGSIKEVLDKFYINRRQQEEQYKEEARERHPKGKHPLLFRYRLG
jgi:hypothetical protein